MSNMLGVSHNVRVCLIIKDMSHFQGNVNLSKCQTLGEFQTFKGMYKQVNVKL